MRRLLVIYDFATPSFWISLYMRKILFYFFISVANTVSGVQLVSCFAQTGPATRPSALWLIKSNSARSDILSILYLHKYLPSHSSKERPKVRSFSCKNSKCKLNTCFYYLLILGSLNRNVPLSLGHFL